MYRRDLWIGSFIERVKPLQISAHRREKIAETETAQPAADREPVVDYLGHLVREKRKQGVIEPPPDALAKRSREKREANTQRIIELLDDRLNHSDTAQKFLINHEKEMGTHPILILDDAEGLYPEVADVVKRLTVYDLDAEDRFSILVCGIEQ
jgi:hypothetical protein